LTALHDSYLRPHQGSAGKSPTEANTPEAAVLSAADLGLTRKDIHEARQLRGAAKAERDIEEAAMDGNERLREIAHKIGTDRIIAKNAWSIWDWISDYAETINNSSFGLALGAYQQMAINETIMAISRMYDRSKHEEEVASVRYAIKALPTAKLARREPLIEYLRAENLSKDVASLSDKDLLSEAAKFLLMRRPTDQNNDKLKRIVEIRNNRIAHRALSKSELNLFEADVSFCFAWVDDFLQMLSEGFNIGRVYSDAKSPRTSLARLCKAAGILDGPLAEHL
jgi:hypothetical protein